MYGRESGWDEPSEGQEEEEEGEVEVSFGSFNLKSCCQRMKTDRDLQKSTNPNPRALPVSGWNTSL